MTRKWLDEKLIELLSDRNGHLITSFSYKFKCGKYPRISEYLRNRFDEFVTYSETYARLKLRIEEHPKCLYCSNPTKYGGWKLLKKTGLLYYKFCSTRCSNIYNINNVKETCKRKYGTISVSQTKWFRNRVEKTCLKKYGTKCNLSNNDIKEKIKETCKKKYGVEHITQALPIKNKIRNSLLERYGIKCGYNKPDVIARMKSKESQLRRTEALKRNKSYIKSIPEENLNDLLVEKYGKDNIERQFLCKEYPWHCDFYIKSIDTFIELQGMWTHGKHPYNPDSIQDQIKLQQWQAKVDAGSKFYKNAIKVWTISDVKKRNIAKQNNLKYIEVFDSKNFEILYELSIL